MKPICDTPHRLTRARRLLFVSLFILLSTWALSAQRRERVVESWRPVHFDVDLTFDEQMTQLASARTRVTVEVLAATLDKIDLDFGEMLVDSVLLANEPAKFDRTPGTLNVLLPTAAK